MSDERAAQILRELPGGSFVLTIKFLREDENAGWVVEDKFDPVRREEMAVIENTKATRPKTLTGIDKVYYINAYPVTAVIYSIYPLREPDLERLAPLRDGGLICVAQRVVEHFDGSLRGLGLTASLGAKNVQELEEGS